MINFDFEKLCYSCSACKHKCKSNAIWFDEKLIPKIERNTCINCGICDSVCIYENNLYRHLQNIKESKSWVAVNKNKSDREKSSSGGIFILLARSILENGGYICGCVYDSQMMPQHITTNQYSDVKMMMGSKYVQSDMCNCIDEMKTILEQGKKVLFSGVPCQVAAVRRCLPNYDNLFLVSVACHGSISRDVWKKYIEFKQTKGIIKSITMRDKSHGWLNYGLRIEYENGAVENRYRHENGYFLKAYTDGLFDRDRCLNCSYKGNNILSDLILADGWGLEEYIPDEDPDKGISSIICLTTKGKKLFELISKQLNIVDIDVARVIEKNKRLISCSEENKKRIQFQKMFLEFNGDLDELCKKYVYNSFPKRLINKVIRLLKN